MGNKISLDRLRDRLRPTINHPNSRWDLGSDEVLDDEVADQTTGTDKKKKLFHCDFVPVSSKVLRRTIVCAKCNKDVECVYKSLLYKSDNCFIFTEPKCQHKGIQCRRIELNKTTTLSTELGISLDFEESSPSFCKSHKSNKLYFSSKLTCHVYLMNVKTETTPWQISGEKLFQTSSSCHAIACFGDGFALLIEILGNLGLSPYQIQYVTSTGKIKHHVYKWPNGDPFFTAPSQIASNHDENLLYVSDNCNILVLDMNGVLKKAVPFEVNPTAIIGDPEGNIYVVCGGSLLQYNKKLKRRIILDKNEEDDACIDAITWVSPLRSLIVLKGKDLTVLKFEV